MRAAAGHRFAGLARLATTVTLGTIRIRVAVTPVGLVKLGGITMATVEAVTEVQVARSAQEEGIKTRPSGPDAKYVEVADM